MAELPITSTANSLVKRIRALEQRKHREAEGAFFVEGIRPVWQAIDSGADVEVVIVALELLKSDAAMEMIEGQRAAGRKVVQVSRRVMESIAERENPSGLAAIVHAHPLPLDELVVDSRSLWVALEHAGNPGNLGTIIRTVDAVGGSGLILIGPGTDPYNPNSVKASMGTLFSVPIAKAADLSAVLNWRRAHDIALVTTSARAPELYWSARYRLPALFLFGSEGDGLSDAAVGAGDLAVRIPMSGAVDSLNLAVSVGILLYELKRQQSL